jgi:hypothetical protein
VTTAPVLLTVDDVAALLRLHRSTLYTLGWLRACRAPTGNRSVRYDAKRVFAHLFREPARAA